MFNSLLTQQHRIQQIENFISDLTTKGTISMESADMLDRLIPGGIKQIDPDFMFDIDETEEGAPIAMEAALEGLSRVKIAFVIAIIAFIVKYITGLNNNSYDFSSSGGSGGGWGGSAPAKFETKQPPTSQACHTDCDNYIELVSVDIKNLREAYQDAIKRFIGIKHLEIADHRQAELNNLLNNIIPRIIRANGGGLSAGEGVDQFQPTLFMSNGKKESGFDSGSFDSFLNITDKSKITAKQITQGPKVLGFLATNYNPDHIFNQYISAVKLNAGEVSNGLSIPFFLVSKKDQKNVSDFAALIVSLIDGSSGFTQAFSEFEAIVKDPESTKIDTHQGPKYTLPLWGWLSKNLGKETPDKTVIKDFILRLDPIIGEGADMGTNDNAYFNTSFRTRILKRFINKTLTGEDAPRTEPDKGAFDMEGMSSITSKIVSGFLTGELANSIDFGFLSSIEGLSKALESGERDITSLTEACKALELVIENALSVFRNRSESELDGQGLNKLGNRVSKDELTNNFPHMLGLVSSFLGMLLLTLAAGAKYNIEMNKLVKTRCDVVIKTLQSMAQDYYDLLKSMGKIMDENLLPKDMMEKK